MSAKSHWPQLKTYPLNDNWTNTPPKYRIFSPGYARVVATLEQLCWQDAVAATIETLRAFCFQGYENTSHSDRQFYEHILTHDLLFFLGNQGHEIIDDLPIDPKLYDAISHMRSSHYDFYAVDPPNFWGRATLTSLTDTFEPRRINVKRSLLQRKPTIIYARLLRLNFAFTIVGPSLILKTEDTDHTLSTFEATYLSQQKHYGRQFSKQAFLKMNAYQLYESIRQERLIAEIKRDLDPDPGFDPVLLHYPCKILDEVNDKPILTLEVAPETHYEPLLTTHFAYRKKETITVISYIRKDREIFLNKLIKHFADIIVGEPQVIAITNDEVYRSLRHITSNTLNEMSQF